MRTERWIAVFGSSLTCRYAATTKRDDMSSTAAGDGEPRAAAPTAHDGTNQPAGTAAPDATSRRGPRRRPHPMAPINSVLGGGPRARLMPAGVADADDEANLERVL